MLHKWWMMIIISLIKYLFTVFIYFTSKPLQTDKTAAITLKGVNNPVNEIVGYFINYFCDYVFPFVLFLNKRRENTIVLASSKYLFLKKRYINYFCEGIIHSNSCL